ncbi:sphingomyelinase C-like [Diadema antillarum]|uniref:sphingomyelinase C-like n=1 Tax=Diadema antillarum TaxID=105358 RepID=UPI003A844FC9
MAFRNYHQHHLVGLLLMTIFAVISCVQVSGQNCDVDENTPTVWLGDVEDDFYCKGNLTHCSHFGLDYVCEDPDGGSLEPCENGTKVMCASPAVQMADPTPATTLRVLAYNVYEIRYLYFQSGQQERTCRIPRLVFTMHPDLDVIVFNEVFMGGCFAPFDDSIETSTLTIRDMLDQYGFNYYTYTVAEGPGEPFPLLENSGIFVASRWPILKNASRVFNVTETYAVTAKGVMYTEINKTVNGESQIYHVFGTHMQAFGTEDADEVRVTQANIIRNFMLEQNIPTSQPVIYAGDLNAKMNTTNGDDVIEAFDATVPRLVGDLYVTYDHQNNDMFNENTTENSTWLDYVMYSSSHLQPTTATLQVVRPRMDPLEVCWRAISPFPAYPGMDACRDTRVITDLSDHYAVLGTFDFDHDDVLFTTPFNPSRHPSTLQPFTTDSTNALRCLGGWSAAVFVILTVILQQW